MKRSTIKARYGLRTRLMCGHCCRISSYHEVIEGSEIIDNGMMRVAYRCKCGNDDQSAFTDSGNFESECTEYTTWEKKEELDKLEKQVQYIKHRMEEDEKRWSYLWNNEEDSFF
ncbi:hypothetical protein CHUUTOTORO_01580 [Serratia phage vB_SmaM-ChuuTotoro]|nr:hypothetical protein CHUUTOTORO_01580 [Serratia phage vB_SmaM-ChuuTotoro]